MIKNNQGFVLIETLIVTVLAISLITILYLSITPMVTKYDIMTRRNSNIDVVYKLYHLRKMLYQNNFQEEEDTKITCNDINKKDSCHILTNYLDLDNFNLYYINNVGNYLLNHSINEDVVNYLQQYKNDTNILLLEDISNHLIVHLKYQ